MLAMPVSPAASVNPWREALRRTTQGAMLLLSMPILLGNLRRVLLFPHEERPWLLLCVLPIVAAVPVAMWWREATGSRTSISFEIVVSAIAAVAGFSLFVVVVAWTGYLLSGPYTGPMSAEDTLLGLLICAIAGPGSLVLLLSPLLLDAAFFTPVFRKRAWWTVAVVLPVAVVIALRLGPNLIALLR